MVRMASAPKETLFDHAITAAEMGVLLPFPMGKAAWLDLEKDQDTEYGHIFALYMFRGDRAKALEYKAKISDPEYATTLAVIDTLP